MSSYSSKHFPSLKLQSPLFYNHPIGLRFEIGPTDLGVWKDPGRKTLNEEYFDVALTRAISIFESAFASDDEITLVYQQYSDGRQKIRKRHFILEQVSHLDSRDIQYSDVRDLYERQYKCECWKRFCIYTMIAAWMLSPPVPMRCWHYTRPMMTGFLTMIGRE